MNDFVVRIDTAKLNAKQAAAIASAIQGAVLAQLGALDLATPTAGPGSKKAAFGPVGTGSVLFHPEWRGMWLRNMKDLQLPDQNILTVQVR